MKISKEDTLIELQPTAPKTLRTATALLSANTETKGVLTLLIAGEEKARRWLTADELRQVADFIDGRTVSDSPDRADTQSPSVDRGKGRP